MSTEEYEAALEYTQINTAFNVLMDADLNLLDKEKLVDLSGRLIKVLYTDIELMAKNNITYYDALDIVLQEETFIDDIAGKLNANTIANLIANSMAEERIAHSLANTSVFCASAKALYDELDYWRSKGRI